MIFWLSLGGLAAIALFLPLYPLLRADPANPASRADHDIEVFRAQLGELERDRERGLLPEQEAAAARREVEYRLLAAGERASQAVTLTTLSRPSRTVLALFLIFALPTAAIMLYVSIGAPGLPGQPFASRLAPAIQTPENDPRLAALAKFEQLTRDDPADLESWLNLGRVHFALANYDQAAASLKEALDLSGRHPAVLAAYGEALAFAADGLITQGARGAFQEALAADPSEPRARFYLAVAVYQSGRRIEALNQWLAMATGAPSDSAWLPAVQERVRAVANELGRDADTLLAEAAAGPAQPPADPQPLEQAQLAQIRSMVGGLAARLERQPDDLEGWLMLGRSYMVLGQSPRAVAALARAAEMAPEQPQIVAALLVATVTAAVDDPTLAAGIPALTDRVLSLDPNNFDALWYAGVASERAGKGDDAQAYWRRLLALLPADSKEYGIVEGRLATLMQTR